MLVFGKVQKSLEHLQKSLAMFENSHNIFKNLCNMETKILSIWLKKSWQVYSSYKQKLKSGIWPCKKVPLGSTTSKHIKGLSPEHCVPVCHFEILHEVHYVWKTGLSCGILRFFSFAMINNIHHFCFPFAESINGLCRNHCRPQISPSHHRQEWSQR